MMHGGISGTAIIAKCLSFICQCLLPVSLGSKALIKTEKISLRAFVNPVHILVINYVTLIPGPIDKSPSF